MIMHHLYSKLMTIFILMKCAADLDVLKVELSLIPLQMFNKNSLVSCGRINVLQKILECYKLIINRYHKSDKSRWVSLSDIGFKELDDHMNILIDASNPRSQSENYNDCHNYLAASIQDAIDTNHNFFSPNKG
jgi:hypothetical protein